MIINWETETIGSNADEAQVLNLGVVMENEGWTKQVWKNKSSYEFLPRSLEATFICGSYWASPVTKLWPIPLSWHWIKMEVALFYHKSVETEIVQAKTKGWKDEASGDHVTTFTSSSYQRWLSSLLRVW